MAIKIFQVEGYVEWEGSTTLRSFSDEVDANEFRDRILRGEVDHINSNEYDGVSVDDVIVLDSLEEEAELAELERTVLAKYPISG